VKRVFAVADVLPASATFAGIALLAGAVTLAAPEDNAAASAGLTETEDGTCAC
jgi:hypothetical protein